METIQNQQSTAETEHSTLPLKKTIRNLYEKCFELKDGRKLYDFDKCVSFLQEIGKKVYGHHFQIYKDDLKTVYKLLLYMIGDQESCHRNGLHPKKGILLTGPVGCGKTTLMNLLRFFLPAEQRYIMKSCRQITFDFIREGYEVIDKYTNASTFGSVTTFCFDDLGVENNIKYFGNHCNVMAEILLSRYDLFVSDKVFTHLTTNLNSAEIEEHYGLRVRSRLREMFNLVSFDNNIKDKRN